jgi:hypothetical protein
MYHDVDYAAFLVEMAPLPFVRPDYARLYGANDNRPSPSPEAFATIAETVKEAAARGIPYRPSLFDCY